MSLARYAPPPIDQRWLLAALKDSFSEHKDEHAFAAQLQDLIQAYSTWWMLMLNFPSRRIVATGPIWFIRSIHTTEIERYLYDCLNYLGRIPERKEVWGGELDFRGTLETARSLTELFDAIPSAWEPLMRVAAQQKSASIIRLN